MSSARQSPCAGTWRLRALREARDADADAAAQIETPTAAKPTPTRRVKRIVR